MGPPAFSVSSERQANVGLQNCLSFETAVGGIEPSSPRLTVWCSTARPPLLALCYMGTSQQKGKGASAYVLFYNILFLCMLKVYAYQFVFSYFIKEQCLFAI